MQEKIISFLRGQEGYVSGEELSQRLEISRQALWKHIQELKESGYEIVAVPHLGYRISSTPDRLFPFEVAHGLRTSLVGTKIIYFESLASTMDIATAQGAAGTAEGLLVLAESQGKGRGRVGRGWYSPKAKGIYMSLLLRPDIGPAQAPVLTLLAAISVCEAVKAAAGLEAKIKWPNDILINNKKLGGILTELSAETDRVRFAVVGIGLNVNNDKGQLPEGATSLKEQKKEELSRLGVLQELLRRIEQNYFLFRKKGASPVIEKWRQFNLTLGRRVRVLYHRQHLEGQALDVDKDGGLLIRKDSGITVKVSAGDIIFCRQ